MRLSADSGKQRTRNMADHHCDDRQLRQHNFARTPFFTMAPRIMAGAERTPSQPSRPQVVHERLPQLPPRPHSSVLNDSIPLFFIGRNAVGFWVVREAEGRRGGLFFLKRSAKQFARNQTSPWGYATMFLDTPLELDVPNHGSRLVGPIAAAIAIVERRLPILTSLLRKGCGKWRKLVRRICRTIASQRRSRHVLERDLFSGQYTLVSKNDDDLPVP